MYTYIHSCTHVITLIMVYVMKLCMYVCRYAHMHTVTHKYTYITYIHTYITHIHYVHTYGNYNFIVTCVSTYGATRNLQCIPVTCLCQPCFLVVWNIHVLYNLTCATCGIVRHGVAMCVTATQGTCLGKCLTMPYCKNAMKQFFS